MIPLGYMAKRVTGRPDWLLAEQVVDICSASHHVSKAFADDINHWQHNGYWFFDFPELIQQLARENSIDLDGTTLCYYEAYEFEFDEEESQWIPVTREPRFPGKGTVSPSGDALFPTNVVVPSQKVLAGYDIATFLSGMAVECSPLSCNGLAVEVETNPHCLLSTLEQAQRLLESGTFNDSEPGPFRILAVYLVVWP